MPIRTSLSAPPIAGGLRGIEDQLDPGPQHEGNAYTADGPRLPTSLEESIEEFASSAVARKSLGDEAFGHLLQLARHEQKAFERYLYETAWTPTWRSPTGSSGATSNGAEVGGPLAYHRQLGRETRTGTWAEKRGLHARLIEDAVAEGRDAEAGALARYSLIEMREPSVLFPDFFESSRRFLLREGVVEAELVAAEERLRVTLFDERGRLA